MSPCHGMPWQNSLPPISDPTVSAFEGKGRRKIKVVSLRRVIQDVINKVIRRCRHSSIRYGSSINLIGGIERRSSEFYVAYLFSSYPVCTTHFFTSLVSGGKGGKLFSRIFFWQVLQAESMRDSFNDFELKNNQDNTAIPSTIYLASRGYHYTHDRQEHVSHASHRD